MTALALRALAFAERYGITIAVVASDRLSWQSRGPTPGRALEALKATKGELIDLLVRYRLDSAGGLAGDDLLATLRVKGFAVRRYGINAALDDALGGALQLRLFSTPSLTDRLNIASRSGRSARRTASKEVAPQSGVATTEDYAVLLQRPHPNRATKIIPLFSGN